MRAKAGLNRRIAAAGWSTLIRRTTQKAAASPGNRTSQATFRCLACGHADNADINAAKNILAAGLTATARGGRPEVRAPDEARTTGREAA